MPKFNGKNFIVTLDFSSMERQYILNTLEKDNRIVARNKPLKAKEFEGHFGFSPIWPHGKTESNVEKL